MRFDNPPLKTAKPTVSLRHRARLWMLVCMLGGTLFAMQRMRTPEAVQTLGSLLSLDAESNQGEVADAGLGSRSGRYSIDTRTIPLAGGAVTGSQPDRAAADKPVRSANQAADNSQPSADDWSLDESWQAVRDNAPFLSTEQEAWFSLLRRISQTDEPTLARQSQGEVAYAQLRAQPEQYRGRVVTIRGHVLREATKTPAPNQLGIHAYHELVLAPAGGGPWPVTVYSLTLPEDFPRGNDLEEPVVVHGVFFKVRSYSYGDGFGLTPVVLAPGMVWQSPAATSQEIASASSSSLPTTALLGVAVALALGAATLVAAYAFASTRRDRHRPDAARGEITLPDSMTPVKPSPEEEIEALAAQERKR
ncbi:MAG: hypothetical protein AAF961_01830 [Planctomycetota bacterium]